MTDRIDDALRWLTGEFSATPDEFRRALHPGGAMLLTALQTHGYAIHDKRQDRYAVSDAGRRRLAEHETPQPEVVE
jgi:hypothetical protein